MTSRRTLALASVAGGLMLLAGTAIAGHVDSEARSYTGCLSLSSGTLMQIKQGNEPLSACGKKQVEAHFSSGDITAVTAQAGGGLVGGGANGALNVSIRRDCESGQVVKWNGAAWTCASDNDSTQVLVNYRSSFVPIPGDLKDHEVVTLTVPAGTYSLTAIGQVTGPLADFRVACALRASGTEVTSGFGHGHSFTHGNVALFGMRTFATSTVLNVTCQTDKQGVSAGELGIQAIGFGG